MQTRLVVYPVEPGFIWLKRCDNIWTGWKHDLPDTKGELRDVTQLEYGGIKFQVFFLYIEDDRSGKERWRARVTDPQAEHFDMGWGLPLTRMEPWEAEILPKLLREHGLRPTAEPQSVSQAA